MNVDEEFAKTAEWLKGMNLEYLEELEKELYQATRKVQARIKEIKDEHPQD